METEIRGFRFTLCVVPNKHETIFRSKIFKLKFDENSMKIQRCFFSKFFIFFSSFMIFVSWYFICMYVFHDQILTNVQRLFSFVPTFLRYFLFLYLFTFFNDVGDETVILSCNRILGKWTRTIPSTVSLCTREWTEIHQRAMCFFITNYTRFIPTRVHTCLAKRWRDFERQRQNRRHSESWLNGCSFSDEDTKLARSYSIAMNKKKERKKEEKRKWERRGEKCTYPN